MSDDWIAVDWHAQTLSLWHMKSAQEKALIGQFDCLAHSSDQYFECLSAALDGLPEPLKPVPVWSTDGAGNHIVPVPCKPTEQASAVLQKFSSLPALTQDSPACHSFGASAAIIGFITENPKFDGILVLPGDKTLWAHVSAEEVVSMRSFGSIGIFDIQMKGAAVDLTTASDDPAFEEALQSTLSRPESLAQQIGSVQSALFAQNSSAASGAASVLGALIGAELAATRPYWLGQPVALISTPQMSGPYEKALTSQFVPFEAHDRARLAQMGLNAYRTRHVS